MPNSIVQADWYGVFVDNLVIIVTEQLDRIGSCPGSVWCFISNLGV